MYYDRVNITDGTVYTITLPQNVDVFEIDSPIALDFATNQNALSGATTATDPEKGRHPGQGIMRIPVASETTTLYVKRVNSDTGVVSAQGYKHGKEHEAADFVPYAVELVDSGLQARIESLEAGEIKLSTTGGIDATSTGATNLYTVPTGKQAIITRAVFRLTAESSATGNVAAGVGIAAGEDDIVASATLTALDATGKVIASPPKAGAAIGAAAEVVKVGIDTAFSGGSATMAVDLFGYLLDA